MKPPFNSFPHQNRPNSSTSTLPQQVFTSNMLQNSVPMQSPTGIINPQIPFPLNNSNGHPMSMLNMPQAPLLTQPNFMNVSNPILFSLNNHLGLPQLSPVFPPHGNFGNLPQSASQGQIFAPNVSNLPMQNNQNVCLLNGQMCLQNPMQNMQQLLSMEMSNPSLFGNPQFGLLNCNGAAQQVNQNQQNFFQQGNSSAPLKSYSSGLQQSQNTQSSAFMRSQGKSVQNGGGGVSNSNWKNVPGKNFTRNPTREPSRGFQKSQFHQIDNRKRKKFGFNKDQRAKARGNANTTKFGPVNHMNQPSEKKRKSLASTYTEQEIKQWCEERRKNYPTKANINKKLTEKQSNSERIDKEVKMRREQLKEILAKQAELGVEVAEIPSHYLSDSEKLVHGREKNARPLNKRGRFQNKHDKRGRYNRREQFAKKQKLEDNDSSKTSSFNKRKPTLLQKLLSTDIKRDKSRLLQAFRFMVMNSFFKDWPEKPLKFPSVIVKESGVAGKLIEDKSLLVGKDVSEGSSRTTVENFDHAGDGNDNENEEKWNHNIQVSDDENDNNDEDDENDEQMNFYVGGKGSVGEENDRAEEEEGEIVD
ncbi:Nuclear fragile X mental retardation-interacting protein 1, conserved domain protein [Melia azedarach]|uniref:Nuclear fragile X mental retardation-interacting protein 1, conserved domain protein n=1 Tax=Melia azedarach TaxID=155640 RepID=A0ACC1YAA1_MELAZ|nr:Nuclear fragile X mental retardation-interacting protein 1, conserved domain protein [Melia azedarach]